MDYFTKKIIDIQNLISQIMLLDVHKALAIVLNFYDITEDYIEDISGLSKDTYDRYTNGNIINIKLITLLQILLEINCDFIISIIILSKAGLFLQLTQQTVYIELLIHSSEYTIIECNKRISDYNESLGDNQKHLPLFKEHIV